MTDGGASAPAAAPAFTPKDVANCEAWWRADLGVSGSPVDTWTDQKNGYVMQQLTAGKRPTRAGVAALNNQDAVTFDGTDDLLVCTQGNATFKFLHNVYSYFIVLQQRQLVTAGTWFATGGSGASRPSHYVRWNLTGTTFTSVCSNATNASILLYSSALATLNNTAIAAIECTDLANTPDSTCQINALLNATATWTNTPSTANSFAPLTFGARNDLSEFLRGDIAEVAFYSRALNGTEQAQLKAYALSRYNITIT